MTIPRLDAHQHFWVYDAQQYPWIPTGSALHRDWLPEDLAREQAPLDFQGSIAVQARQSLEETRRLLKLAAQFPAIRGVVGWVDLRAENVSEQLAEFVPNPKFVGVRHVVQDEKEPDFLLRSDFVRGLRALHGFGLRYDLLILAHQLPAAIRLVAQMPELPFVLDHLAKPPIKGGGLSPWREQIQELAKAPNVCCKISGLITEADPQHWQPEQITPYLDVAFQAFGVERLMFGSDWPVCLLAGSYERVFRLSENYARGLSAGQRADLFGGNAARFYGIPSLS